MKTKRLTLCGILCAVALTIFVLEAQLPQLLPIPGIKPGLANIVTLFALLYLTPGETTLILVARILLGAFFTGNSSVLLYSLSGGLGCLGVESLLFLKGNGIPVFAISAIGAIVHNLIQICVAALMTQTLAVFWYLPFLLIAGIVTGLFTGFCIHAFSKSCGGRIKRFLS